jgi:hypothetical protein
MKSSKMAGNLIKGNLPGVIFDGVTPIYCRIQSGFSASVNELHAQKLDIKLS